MINAATMIERATFKLPELHSQVQVCIMKGLLHGRAASVMICQYLSIVISQALGMALFHEFSWPASIVGMCLIVGSMLVFMIWDGARKRFADWVSASCKSFAHQSGQHHKR